jgi:hypothetical protein
MYPQDRTVKGRTAVSACTVLLHTNGRLYNLEKEVSESIDVVHEMTSTQRRVQ